MMRVHKKTALMTAMLATLLLSGGAAWAQCDPNDSACAAREREAAQAKLDAQQQAPQTQDVQAPPPADAQQGTGGAQRAQRPKKGGGG